MIAIDKLLTLSSRGKQVLAALPKARLVSASALLLALFAFGAAGVAPMAPDAADLPVTSIVQDLALPEIAEQIARLEPAQQTYVSEDRIRPGDTLAQVLARLGVRDRGANEFIASDATAQGVLQLKPGKRIQAQTAADGSLQWLRTTVMDGRDLPLKNIVVQRKGDSFEAIEAEANLEKRVEMRTGEIKSSLFAATDAAQIPDPVAMQIVDMFSTNIDFRSDLRRGDRFNIVYETFWQGGEYLRSGRVLAAEFRNGSDTYQSVWFDEPGTKQGGGYFGFDGKSLKKAFLKSPLEFSRVSSGFSMRKHPISGTWKRHQGVDFAAATGTPIRASGEGEIHFIGGQGGYGNVVVIKHWSSYTTAYAHMSRFAAGLRKGSKVSQGQVIGYVGTTGWSTGPHLHYEFRVNNVARDPMSVEIPNAQPLSGQSLQRFRMVAGEMSRRIALLSPQDKGVQLAAK